MKKITLLFLFMGFLLHAQDRVEKFELVPSGSNGYIVFDYPGMSSNEIYSKLKKWAEYNIRSAEVSNYSTVENEFLTYRVNIPNAVEYTSIGTAYWDITVDVEYRIKDGKLRVDFENFDFPGESQNIVIQGGGLENSLYNPKGKLRSRSEDMKLQIDQTLNDLLAQIDSSISGNPDMEKSDW